MVTLLEKTPTIDLPEMIILDQNMPKMNGKESLIYLKANERYGHVPTIDLFDLSGSGIFFGSVCRLGGRWTS